MKVLVLSGPESSGKSWLSHEIQAHFGGELVSEYVRHFIDEQRRDTCYADIPAIARGQLAWEDAARARQPELLILDTHLLSNLLWSRVLFGDCPAWIEQALLARHYDLHLLLDPAGVSWVGDGQRCQPALEQRQGFLLTASIGCSAIASLCRSLAVTGPSAARQPSMPCSIYSVANPGMRHRVLEH